MKTEDTLQNMVNIIFMNIKSDSNLWPHLTQHPIKSFISSFIYLNSASMNQLNIYLYSKCLLNCAAFPMKAVVMNCLDLHFPKIHFSNSWII